MSTPEGVITAPTPDAPGNGNSNTPSVADTSAASPSPIPTDSGSTASSATAGNVQDTTTQDDVLAGVPSLDELNQLPDNSPLKKSLVQMRTAIEQTFKPQLSELTEKYKPFEPFADRFSSSEELQSAVEFKDKFLDYKRNGQGQLEPFTQETAQFLVEKHPEHSRSLWADMSEMQVQNPATGQMAAMMDIALETMAEDPTERAKALRILGGVEPSAIAPTWLPSAEELAAIPKDPDRVTPEEKALQDVYGKLPYDERESLKLNDPDFIRNYLKKEQFQQNLIEQNRVAQERETRQNQQREQYIQKQAQDAGNKYVENGFRQGMTEFTKSVVDRSKFITPLDPSSDVAKQMAPEQVTAYNTQAEQINTGVGRMIAVVAAALSHPDTAWVASDFLKGLGLEDQVFQKFNESRTAYAENARNYGELEFSRGLGQNGGQPNTLGPTLSNATSAMKNMKGHANAVVGPLFNLLSNFFEMKANSFNQSLNGVAATRPAINGTAYNPATAPISRQPRDPSDAWNPARSIEQFLPR